MQIILLDYVESFLKSLHEKEIAKVIKTIELLEEFEHMLELPHSKYLSDGILELRIKGKREIRILYCFHGNKIFLLHSFIKKTQKLPKKELSKALVRKNNLQKYNL